jgi:four helix bundle protein
MDPVELDFARWETTPPPELFGDSIWRLPAYRISRYLALAVRKDVKAIREQSPALADQLERSVDSIGINIAEGYGRLYGRERARFYEFALGSAREAREWYARVDAFLENGVAEGRAILLTRAIKVLTVAIPQERAGSSERRMKAAAAKRGTSKE